MLSRVAENLYWMSRYIERADNLARLVRAHQNELLDATSMPSEENFKWHPLLEVTQMGDEDSTEGVVTYMVSSAENPDSIRNCVFQCRENARAVRDQISEEMWLELNELWLKIKEISSKDKNCDDNICGIVVKSSMRFRGIVNTPLPRTEAWAFVQMGEYLERADKTSRLVDLPSFLPKSEEESAWNTILRACSATAQHRQSNKDEVNGATVSSMLLFSTTFPRSFRFCVGRINELLHSISGTDISDYLNEAERASGALLARLNFNGVAEIGKLGLHEYIDSIQTDLNDLGFAIGCRYFLLSKDAPETSPENYVKTQMRAQEVLHRKKHKKDQEKTQSQSQSQWQ